MTERKVRSIQCTSCAAPLSLHGGGHKIETLTCSYCGSVLDVHEEFKVLAKFSDQKTPFYAPLKLGMKGEVKGVGFTVIGMVEWVGGLDRWIDYQVFSPTHGYAWLVYEVGHWIFLRRTRNLPDRSLWTLSSKQAFKVNDQTFRFYEKYKANISYVAGELTWIAYVGDKTTLAEAIDPPYIYSAERSENESEYYYGEYIEGEDILASFGASEKYPPARMHPLKPYQSKILEPLSKASKPFALIALFAVFIIVVFMDGSKVKNGAIDINASASIGKVEVAHDFAISKANRLVKLELDTRQSNILLDINVRKKGEEPFVFIGSKSSVAKVDKSTQLKQNVTSATAYFIAPSKGVYTLKYLENGSSNAGGGHIPTVKMSAKEGYVSSYYFVWLLIISGVLAVVGIASRWMFESSRWKASTAGYD